MKSPFAIFRKHEKVMMVILVGMSMIGFVLLGAFNNPSDSVPPVLIFLIAMAVFGMAAWIAGMPSGRSKEFGGWGLVLGLLVSILFIRMSRPASAVSSDLGNISSDELHNLQTRRELANKFVYEAIRVSAEPGDPTTDQRLALAQFRFGANATSPRDVVLGEILRREAEQLGLQANKESVTQYIQKMTSNRITGEKFNEILSQLHLSENQLYDILEEQLQAKVAAQMLYEPTFAFPPEQYWEFYRQLYIKQSAEVAAVPVKDFVDSDASPPDSELNRIFVEYRENYPNQTKEGRLDEGRPGLFQPRRARLAYFEATYDEAVSGIPAVTEEEIKEYYEENYKRPAEEAARRNAGAGSSSLSAPVEPAAEPEVPGPSLPASEGTPPSPTKPAEPSESSDNAPGSATESPAKPAGSEDSAAPSSDTPEGSSPPSSDCAQEPEAAPAKSDEPTASGKDSPAANAPTPDANAPSAEEPASGTTGEPAATSTETPAESTTTPAVSEPPLPRPSIPLLDDDLKETIRTTLMDKKVAEKLNSKLIDAAAYVQDEIGRAFIALDQDADPMTPERAAELAKTYAAEHHLHYDETPFLSTFELIEQKDDYPVGMAETTTPGREDFVARAIFATGERDLYRPIIARNADTKSWFACWKVGEEQAYAPENMTDERVRDQVIAIWRQTEARKRAEARAQELAQLVRDSEKPMMELLSDQRITGSEQSLFLQPVNTGEFHYQAFANQLDPNPLILQYLGQPQILSPTGVEKAGPEFMETVFNDLSPGDVGVATNVDHSTYYVVKVLTRSQSTPEEFELFRKRFLQEPLFGYPYGGRRMRSVYQNLAIGELQQNLLDWQDQLLRKHNVQLSSLDR